MTESDHNQPVRQPSAVAVLQRTQSTLGLLREVVQEGSAEYWYELGMKTSALKEWAEASYSFGRCLGLNALHWRGALQLAVALSKQQQGAEAAKALLKAYEGPFFVWSDFVKEVLAENWQELKSAFDSYRGSAQNGFQVLLALAIAQRATGAFAEISRTLDAINFLYAQQAQGCASWHYLSGSIWHDEKEWHKAESSLNIAIHLNPTHLSSYFYRGQARKQLKDYYGAIEDADYMIKSQPNRPYGYHLRWSSNYRLGNDTLTSEDFSNYTRLAYVEFFDS